MTAEWQDLPFEEAIAFLRGKVDMPTETWHDILGAAHNRAFVVAGAMKTALLDDLHNALNDAIAKGTTISEFRKAFDKTVQKHGWSYKGKRGWRTAVIFDTNLRGAYAHGHYQQSMTPAVRRARPYFRYIGGLSEHPRPLHLGWTGTVLPNTDPWWATHYPPNGYGCKCKVVTASASEIARDGYEVAPKAPDDGTYNYVDRKTGEVIENIPKGIDPGFDYNPGLTPMGGPPGSSA